MFALCTFSTPLIFTQSTMFFPGLAMGAVSLLMIYFWQRKRIVVALALVLAYQCFTAIHSFDFLQTISQIPLTEAVTRAEHILCYLLLQQYRWVFTVLAALGLWLALAQHKRPPRHVLLFCFVILVFAIFFAFDRTYLIRHLGAALGFFFLAALYLVQYLLPGKVKLLLWPLGLCFIWQSFLLCNPKPFLAVGSSYEDNMLYLQIIENHKKTAHFLTEKYSNKKIFANWPLITALAEPFAGYINSPLQTVPDPQLGFDVAAVSANGDQQFQKVLQELLMAKKIYPVQTIGDDIFYTVIYEKAPTAHLH